MNRPLKKIGNNKPQGRINQFISVLYKNLYYVKINILNAQKKDVLPQSIVRKLGDALNGGEENTIANSPKTTLSMKKSARRDQETRSALNSSHC